MKKIKNEELKKNLLEMIKYIDAFCRNYNIKYTMVGGTLLGAIRHKGFIPWDDDIDIAMKRDEYNKFIKLFNEFSESKYKVLTNDIDETYYHPFAKVVRTDTYLDEKMFIKCENLGLYIDIFPIDKIDEKNLFYKVWRSKILYNLNCLAMCNDEYYKKKPIYKRFLRRLAKIHKNKFYIKKMNKLAQKDNLKNCKYSGMIMNGQGKKDVMPFEMFENYIDLSFEDCKLMSVENYELFLINVFGDYMCLPPESERKSVHNFVVYEK